MGNLIRNERLKLYKKLSTWILASIIVALSLLILAFSHWLRAGNSYVQTWEDWRRSYESDIEYYTMVLNEEPNNLDAAKEREVKIYQLENELTPSDWRSGAIREYLEMKYSGVSADPSGNAADGAIPAPDAETQERMDALMAMMQANDWRAYVNQKINDLESGYTPSDTEEEKQVSIEMYQMYLQYDVPPDSGYGLSNSENWKFFEIDSIYASKLALLQGEYNGELLTQNKRAELEQGIAVSTLRIATDTPPVQSSSFLGQLENVELSMKLVTLLLIVLAGGIVSTEFSTGTVKLLLITPHRRQRIFWAKAVILLEITLITVAALFVLSFLLSGILTGFEGIGAMQVMTLFGRAVRFPYLLYIVMKLLLLLLPVLAYGALALMLSVVTRKSAVAIAVSLLLMYGSEIVLVLVYAFISDGGAIPGIKFLFFANTSLESYLPFSGESFHAMISPLSGVQLDPSMTLGFSTAIVVIYAACFLWIARDSFCRRDIK